ncbi:MAG: CHAT domain-containing protein [Altererythrobacter sp.]|nr:CHAT domain-containing protein [Altererythrobacter sp.]
MSACQTALGRVLDGGGFGIARSWTTVGAGQVVSSLWNVSDNATKILMNHFLERLKAGDTPEIAMQKAQLKTMQARTRDKRQPYLDDPKMWASFSIYGKPSG